MRKAFYIFFIILLISACSQNQQEEVQNIKTPSPPSPDVKTVMERIAKVDIDPDHYPSRSQYHQEVNRQIADIVGELSSPSQLKTLFYKCHRFAVEGLTVPQDCLSWMDPFWAASQTVLFRLAELKSYSATGVLIDLFTDEDIGWDGESALNICNAISRCGARAIPYLSNIKSARWENVPKDIAHCIRRGELYGP